MGLTFTVGAPSNVFFGDFADLVEQELSQQLQYSLPTSDELDPYYSEEFEWFGWAQLQQSAVAALGKDAIPHFLSVEAWRGVYLPTGLSPTTIAVDEDAWLQCASLPGLISELEQYAAARSLPTDPMGLSELWETAYSDEDATDTQAYAQLMLTAQVAQERNMPMWVVK